MIELWVTIYHSRLKKPPQEMLEIQNVDILNENELNIVKRRSKKTQILLYDTQRRFDDFVMKLKYRNNGKYEDIPHFIISKTGKIYKIFNTNYSSITFREHNIDKKQIKIAIENLGWLNKNTITGILHNWINDPYRIEPFIKKWRGFYFWDKYTEDQQKSVSELCSYLSETHKIPYQSVPSQAFFNNATKFNGIICKSNFTDIYRDINPSFDFKIFNEHDKENK